jgi:uncharacterized protein with PIN domain
LDRLLREAAEVSVALEHVDGTWEETPHYTRIELRAHELGRRLAREVQQRRMGELAAGSEPTARCPECGTRCPTKPRKRRVPSIAGPVELIEPVCQCPACRRAFFPSADEAGL